MNEQKPESANEAASAQSELNVRLGGLLPCPNCGGVDLKIGHSPGGFSWVYCRPCHIKKHTLTDADAVVEWNNRHNDAQVEIERLRAALVECEHQTHSMRVWGGQSWTYHPPQAGKIANFARAALDVPNVELTGTASRCPR